MFTTQDFHSQSKYQVLNNRDTEKSVILINFSEQHPVKSFLRQDAAHYIGVTGGKLLRVKTSWQCCLRADRQIRARPQRGTFREKTQSKRTLRSPVNAWDVTQEKVHLRHWASGSTTATQQPANYWHQSTLRNGKRKTTSRHNIQRVEFSGDMQSQHKGLYLLKIKHDAKHSFIFNLIFPSLCTALCTSPALNPLCFNSEKW